MSSSRIEAFSDGVFAIAITLLVLEIQVPDVHGGGLLDALGDLWPSYAAYAVSFLTIGIIWVNHHTAFGLLARADRKLLFLNLALLMTVSFIPFPTSVLARYLQAGSDQHVAAVTYSGTMALQGLAFGAVALYAIRAGLTTFEVTPSAMRRLRWRSFGGFVGYAAASGLAFVDAVACLAMCAVVALYYAAPGPESGLREQAGVSGP